VLKITSGIFRGQIISRPKTDQTRPVTEQTRQAIFQVLGDVEGLSALDLYAGSGALGFEALSLGCKKVTFVDSGSVAIQAIKLTASSLPVSNQSRIIKSTFEKYFSQETEKYNLIFFDPPYADFSPKWLENAFTLLKKSGIVVTSSSSKTELETDYAGAELVKQKNYGDTTVGYYRKKVI